MQLLLSTQKADTITEILFSTQLVMAFREKVTKIKGYVKKYL
jgi:hypothetical protein